MPRIYTSQVSANSLRSNASGPRSTATGAAFGQNVGLANQALGNQIQNAGNTAASITINNQNKKKEQEIANAVAMHDTTEKQLKLRNEVGEDGDTYNDRIREMYIDDVEDYTNDYEDDYVREQVRTKLMSRLPSVSSTAAQHEVGLEAEASANATNDSLSTLSNRVRVDPLNYDQYVQDGENVIAASGEVPEALKASMKRIWRNDSARKRFDGLIENATTIESLDNIAKDLAGEGDKDWQAELNPPDFDTLLNQIGSARKQFSTKLGANARAGLQALEGRIEGSTNVADMLVPSDELEQVQGFVKQYSLASRDNELNKRMGRFMRDQEIIRTNMRLPIEEIKAQINKTNGRPNVAYPDMPPVLSGAINEAQQKFGVNASYLGAKIQREYGQFLKKPTIKAGKRFKPQTLNDDVVLDQLPHDVLNAATVAGQAIGTPVVLGKPKGSNALTNGISISTVGMGTTEKIKMTQALVDAGFTGFAQVDGFLQVNMEQQVPETFGAKDGKFWGGWTDLSPEVSEVLLSKGFEPGKASAEIDRKNAIVREDDIDFGRGTTLKKADGTPGSSALGVMQFVKGTWLGLMKDENVTALMGIDTAGKSDEELLQLRADPRLSVLAGAAYAQQNKNILEGSLNRQVNDAELYMAHFLGPQGALGLITANRNTPGGLAAKLFPDAAASNRPVFYDGNRMKTVQEVVGDISRTIGLSPSQVTFQDNQLRTKLADKLEKSLKANIIEHVAQTGTFDVPALDAEGGFKARGALMTSASDYYRMPVAEAKAFTDDEVTFLQKRISTGSVDDNLALMAEIRSMGEQQSVAAFNQLGKFDPTFAHAGDLYLQGSGGVAADVVRGQKRLTENPAIRTQIGANEQDVQDAFVSATEGALIDIAPADRQAIQDAAFAHYLQSMSKGNKLQFKPRDFANSVQSVMGGTETSPAIDYVNGRPTVLPPGVNADLVENALDRMAVEDWASMSKEGKPPRYRDGTVVNPQDVRDEAMLRAIGGGQYHVMLDDGSRLITDDFTADGRPKAFVFTPDADKLKQISSRPAAVARGQLPRSYFLD